MDFSLSVELGWDADGRRRLPEGINCATLTASATQRIERATTMANMILGTGLACLVAAIVGGGFSAFGLPIPVISSLRRQLLLGLLGGVLIVLAIYIENQQKPMPGGTVPARTADSGRAASREAIAKDEEQPVAVATPLPLAKVIWKSLPGPDPIQYGYCPCVVESSVGRPVGFGELHDPSSGVRFTNACEGTVRLRLTNEKTPSVQPPDIVVPATGREFGELALSPKQEYFWDLTGVYLGVASPLECPVAMVNGRP